MQIRLVPLDHPDAVALTRRLQAFYVERYGGPDDDPMEQDQFAPPVGAFYVGYDGERPVATGAFRPVGDDRLGTSRTAEIKRMYVVPEAQRRGLAREMLRQVEEAARAAGYEALLLSTGSRQPEALAFYEAAGYVPVEGFGHYGGAELNRCYGRRLD